MASTTFDPRAKEQNKGAEHLDKIKDAGTEALNKAKEVGREAMDMTKEAGADAVRKAKDAGNQVLGKAKETATAVGEMATQAVSAVGQKADDLTAAAGHGIREFGDSISQKGPHDGISGAASRAVAEGIKGGGHYLEEAKLSGMAHDVEQLVKNHPIPALLVCLGVGFCLGRAMRD